MLPQALVLIDLQELPEQQEIAPLRDMNTVAPIAEILDRRIERNLRPVSAGSTKLFGQGQIIQMPLLDTQRIQHFMPCLIAYPIPFVGHIVPPPFQTPGDYIAPL